LANGFELTYPYIVRFPESKGGNGHQYGFLKTLPKSLQGKQPDGDPVRDAAMRPEKQIGRTAFNFEVGEIVEMLEERGISAVGYHAGMEAQERRENQERWMADEADVLVDGRTQLDKAGFTAALAVEYNKLERVFAIGQADTAVRVHAFDAEAQIALDRSACIGERPRHAFDHGNANGR